MIPGGLSVWKPMDYSIDAGRESDYTNATLSELPGSSDLALEYNEALKDFKVLSRAVDLNLNINQTPEENLWVESLDNLTESLIGYRTTSETSEDEVRDTFVGILEHGGYG